MSNAPVADHLSSVPFKYINCIDTEFRITPGELPDLVCLVVRELRSGQVQRFWRDDLRQMTSVPFESGSDALCIAYSAQAEIQCFLKSGWLPPTNIVDQYAEFRVQTNGATTNASLLHALAHYNLPHMATSHKEGMRHLIMGGEWDTQTSNEILDYCEEDVNASEALFIAGISSLDLPRAQIRGQYCSAVARMESTGIPIDVELLRLVRAVWPVVRLQLIAEVDAEYQVYDGDVFKRDRFSRWLQVQGISWPRTETGLLDLSDEAFKQRELLYASIAPLRELRNTVRQVDLCGLQVGRDGRARTSIRPFSSLTGRNQPSALRFAFGSAKWMRGFIAPDKERDLAYLDFSSQEIAIAAGLSGDERLIAAYLDEDPYISFAKQAQLVPADATKFSHPEIRNACKIVVLGLNYGMGPHSIALQAGISVAHARELMLLHHRTYRVFWEWSDNSIESALLARRMRTVFGWQRRLVGGEKLTSVRNFPMQANGAEMMRLAAIGAARAGIEICAPVHDAFLLAAPKDRLEADVLVMRDIMTQAGITVCGIPVRTDAKLIRYPDRYMEERGIEMWNRVMRLADLDYACFSNYR